MWSFWKNSRCCGLYAEANKKHKEVGSSLVIWSTHKTTEKKGELTALKINYYTYIHPVLQYWVSVLAFAFEED
jgi:hypothetical protein